MYIVRKFSAPPFSDSDICIWVENSLENTKECYDGGTRYIPMILCSQVIEFQSTVCNCYLTIIQVVALEKSDIVPGFYKQSISNRRKCDRSKAQESSID
jgi:hypothetical protein